MIKVDKENLKGLEFNVRFLAMITLGVLVVVSMYLAFESTTERLIDSFLGEIRIPDLD